MDYSSGTHKDSETQRDSPDVERQVGIAKQPGVEGRQQIPYNPGQQARHNQQGENLGEYLQEGRRKIQPVLWIDQRSQKRHQNGDYDVDDYGICHHPGHIASKLTGHHGAGSGRGANHTKHRGFKAKAERKLRAECKKQGKGDKRQALDQKQRQHPFMGLHSRGLNLAETQKEHQEEQHRLDCSHSFQEHRTRKMEGGQSPVCKIQPGSAYHTDNQGPIPQKLGKSVFILFACHYSLSSLLK